MSQWINALCIVAGLTRPLKLREEALEQRSVEARNQLAEARKRAEAITNDKTARALASFAHPVDKGAAE